jgi:hypothetical protein
MRPLNEILRIFMAHDPNGAQVFADSTDPRQTMYKAGVTDMLDICLLQR